MFMVEDVEKTSVFVHHNYNYKYSSTMKNDHISDTIMFILFPYPFTKVKLNVHFTFKNTEVILDFI